MDCFLNNPNLPTALIALLVALITFNQYRVAKAKLKLDLFERRFNIFHKAWTSLSEAVIDESKIQQYGFWSPFNNDLHEASFLFGKKVTKYLDKCVYQWNQLRTYSIEKKSVPATPENIEKWTVLQMWFVEEAQVGCKKVFDPYLDFKNWK